MIYQDYLFVLDKQKVVAVEALPEIEYGHKQKRAYRIMVNP